MYNRVIEESGWYENRCVYPDHPGIQPDSVFLNGCGDWTNKKPTVSREDDEYVYQPKIHKDRIKALYLIKEATGIPMTVLLDRAIEQYLAARNLADKLDGDG